MQPENTTQSERERWFRLAFDLHFGDLDRYCQRRCASPIDAEDIVAETFAIAWRRIDHIPGGSTTRPWLFGIARNLLREHYRRGDWVTRVTQRLKNEMRSQQTETTAGEDVEAALDALMQLREADRELIQLVVWDELPHSEAAEILGCSVNAIAIRLHRARGRLREQVAKMNAENAADRGTKL